MSEPMNDVCNDEPRRMGRGKSLPTDLKELTGTDGRYYATGKELRA